MADLNGPANELPCCEERLAAIRELMANCTQGPLDAYIVPSEDAHQSEYVADRDKRREFISGFSGSAGLAVVTNTAALLWTDGRYFLQAKQQLSKSWKLMRLAEDPPAEQWLAENLPPNSQVGVDPWTISAETARIWQQAFEKRAHKLVSVGDNLVDCLWHDRPDAAVKEVREQTVKFAGKSATEKIQELRKRLQKEKAVALVVTDLAEVAWLFNIRGDDVQFSPVVHAYGLVSLERALLFVDKRKMTDEVITHLAQNGVLIRDYNEVVSEVVAEAQKATKAANGGPGCSTESKLDSGSSLHEKDLAVGGSPGQIWLDPATCNFKIVEALPRKQLLLQQSPLALAKALKNPVELEGMRQAHIRDAVALVQFFAWLDEEMQRRYGAAGYFSEGSSSLKRKSCDEEEPLTEVSVADKLCEFRSQQEHFMGLSFPTISSVGPNAAIIHYGPQKDTCAHLDPQQMYLCDSGGQYLDGTTDVTRTLHFGKPSAHERACVTRVLQGHIALDMAIFPNGTTGHVLDILARVPLWKVGLDYRHGTGHGVGSFLNVHEGPHLISFRPAARNVPIQANMTVTNEPGYYEDGAFGCRVENVMIVKETKRPHNFGDKGFLCFEPITLVPIQAKLIDTSLLTRVEVDWINSYHERCRETLSPHLQGTAKEWFLKAIAPISLDSTL